MRFLGSWILVTLLASVGLYGQAPAEPKSAPTTEAKGLPPRAAPTDYAAHAQAGAVTIAADFTGHSVPVPEGPLSTEDYVTIEVALYGPAEAKTTLSIDDFTLRLNGKKTALASQPTEFVSRNLKDPEWVPPDQGESKKSKGGLSSGGGGQNDPPPVTPRMPPELRRAMAQHVQKASLPVGDRALPQAGLIFFEYRGKMQALRSIELIYSGAAGKATLALQP
jgi:hypothetical protein